MNWANAEQQRLSCRCGCHVSYISSCHAFIVEIYNFQLSNTCIYCGAQGHLIKEFPKMQTTKALPLT